MAAGTFVFACNKQDFSTRHKSASANPQSGSAMPGSSLPGTDSKNSNPASSASPDAPDTADTKDLDKDNPDNIADPIAEKEPTAVDGDKAKTDKDIASSTGDTQKTNDLSVTEDDITLIPATFAIARQDDTAGNNNCLFFSINKQPEQALGCNKSGGVPGTITVKAKPKPNCNIIHLRLTTNGYEAWKTSNASDISKFFQLRKSGTKLVLKANDNDDNDFNDLNMTFDGHGLTNLMVENSKMPCN